MNTLEGELLESDTSADTEGDKDEPASKLVLVFTTEGQAVLEEDDEPVWMSDDDDDFQIDFGDEFLEPDEDSAKIINWLVKNDWVSDDEKSEIEIEIEDDGGDDSEIESE